MIWREYPNGLSSRFCHNKRSLNFKISTVRERKTNSREKDRDREKQTDIQTDRYIAETERGKRIRENGVKGWSFFC